MIVLVIGKREDVSGQGILLHVFGKSSTSTITSKSRSKSGGGGCVAEGLPLSYGPDDGFARSPPHPFLPMDDFAFAFLAWRTVHRLPFSSDVFRLFSRSGRAAWRAARNLAGNETSGALSPLGRAGRRSCTTAILGEPLRPDRRRAKGVSTFDAARPQPRL